jgi:DNA helicase-2/ATP-dependent DNA helicase PcrA
MTLDLATLNETQFEAVQWDNSPLLVLAGPGSGKTRVLTYRIARLIETTPGQHFKILGLTFTNMAAAEMRDRIASLVPNAGERVLLSTFHSFAGDVLRQHGHLIGLRPDFTILSQDTDRAGVLEEAIAEAGLVAELGESGEKLLPVITRLLDLAADDVSAPELLSSISAREPEALAKAYSAYRRRMIARNSMDFGSLIVESLRLLREKPAVRRQIQRIYTHVLVDEFQDTSKSQYEFLTLLVNPVTKNLFVVADDDQIIYQWNGASPERLQALETDFAMSVLQLPENYRCPPEVIDLANSLIAHNVSRSADKQALRARKRITGQQHIRLKSFRQFGDEAEWIANDIAARDLPARARCVVLARARKLLEEILAKLEKRGVSAYLAVRKDEWASAPMRLLHSCLRLANARQDRDQLRRVCKSFYAVEGIDLDVKDIVSAAASYEGDYLRAFTTSALKREAVDLATREFLEHSLPKLADRLDYASFMAESFLWFDHLVDTQSNAHNAFEEYPLEKTTWSDLYNEISLQYGADNVTLHLLLQEMDLRSKAPRPPVGAVPCHTIHAAKGLEFDHVYLAGLVEDQLPSWAAVKKGEHSREMQEERRNCFVAITRTQETLTVTYSQVVQGWRKTPSRFLYEMGLVES